MKRFFLSILFISSAILSYSQVETRYYQKGDSVSPIMDLLRLNQNVNTKRMPAFDLEKMKKEDAEMEDLDVPYRFGKGFDVCYTLSDGNWQNIDGGRLWTLSFESEGALSLNFI